MSQAAEWADDERGKAWVELWRLLGLLELRKSDPLAHAVARSAERLGMYTANAVWWDEMATDEAVAA